MDDVTYGGVLWTISLTDKKFAIEIDDEARFVEALTDPRLLVQTMPPWLEVEQGDAKRDDLHKALDRWIDRRIAAVRGSGST